MSDQVTVNIPERLYRRARALARERRRPLDAVIAEALEQGMPPETSESAAMPDDQETAVQREMAAYIALHPSLKTQYYGRHVAILDGQLIDHDGDKVALYRRIAARYPDRFVWLTAVEDEPLPTIHARSPRLVASE